MAARPGAGSGLLDYPVTQGIAKGKDRLFQIAVARDAVPAPLIPHGEELLDIADGLNGKFRSARPVIRKRTCLRPWSISTVVVM